MADELGHPATAGREVLALASSIVAAYVSRNSVPAAELPSVIKSIHATLNSIAGGSGSAEIAIAQKPAVPLKRSITADYIVCLEDGKRMKMLKRYLRSTYELSPEEYRAKWGLPRDYPMVAPSYAATRSELAKKIGLDVNRDSAF